MGTIFISASDIAILPIFSKHKQVFKINVAFLIEVNTMTLVLGVIFNYHGWVFLGGLFLSRFFSFYQRINFGPLGQKRLCCLSVLVSLDKALPFLSLTFFPRLGGAHKSELR